MPISKKKNLRRCTACHKLGHNKATCPEPAALSTPPNNPPPRVPAALKLFVHHVTHPAEQSDHLIDLKRGQYNVWDRVQGAAPSAKPISLYQSYHQRPASALPPNNRTSISAVTSFTKNNNLSLTTPPISSNKALPSLATKPHRHTAAPRIAHHKTLYQAMLATAILSIIFFAPFAAKSYYTDLDSTKKIITENGLAGFSALQDAAHAIKLANIPEATASTQTAWEKFDAALSTLDNNHRLLQTIAATIPGLNNSFLSREKILLAGQEITVGNSFLLAGFKAEQSRHSEPLTNRLAVVTEYMTEALPNYNKALENLEGVDNTTLPLEQQQAFADFRTIFKTVISDFNNISDLGATLQGILGGEGQRRYLIVFQNQHELRPTGGFAGSLAVLTVKDGALVNLEIPAGGSYDLQGQLDTYVEPPAPLLLSNKRWEFQDANWFPDFPASAEKMLWFYRHSRGQTLDGVMAINASVLERLLSIVGPLTNAGRGLTLTSSNVLATLQGIVEEGPEKKLHQPKKILGELAPQLLDMIKTAPASTILPLLSQLQEAVQQKEIQAYFTDATVENAIRSLGWGGEIVPLQPGQDYLLVVNANIRGEKSDRDIKQSISHQAVVSDEGTVTDTVTITREHRGRRGEKLYGQTNIDFLRLYVPEGSTLIKAGGFSWPDEKSFSTPDTWYQKDEFLSSTEKEVGVDQLSGTRITNEFGRTAFGNWIITAPGSLSKVQFVYRLPFKLDGARTMPNGGLWQEFLAPLSKRMLEYNLVAQKQSGISSNFEHQIIFSDNWTPLWSQGENVMLAKNGAAVATIPFLKDTIWGVIMQMTK